MPGADGGSTGGRARGAKRQGRAPWGSITREQVVDAAMQQVEAGRYELMTIRSLAADIGVAPMSLYRHVRDKDDLLSEVVDRMLSRVWRPRAPRNDWRAWMSEASDRLRRFLVAQPAALHVFLQHPLVTPAAVERMEVSVSVLEDAGLTPEQARRAYGTVHTYTLGFAALQASRQRAASEQRLGDEANPLAEEMAAFASDEQYAMGLRYLFEGIGRESGL